MILAAGTKMDVELLRNLSHWLRFSVRSTVVLVYGMDLKN